MINPETILKHILSICILTFLVFSNSCSYRLTMVQGNGIQKEFNTQGDHSDYNARKAFRHIERKNFAKYNNDIYKDTLKDALVFRYDKSGIALYNSDSIYSDLFLNGTIYPELLKIDSNDTRFVMIEKINKSFQPHRICLRFKVFDNFSFENVYIELTNKKTNKRKIKEFLKQSDATFVKAGFIEI